MIMLSLKQYTKTFFITVSFFCGSYWLPAQQPKADQRPNILFILCDDFTAQAWGVYGGILKDVAQTTHIQQLAAKGMVLNNAFCTNSICVPSRATIATGQYSNRNGVYTLGDALSPDSMNIAKVLQQNGYQTALIGKWHLKLQPSGFDHFMVMPGQGVYFNPVFKTEKDWQAGEYENGKKYPGYNTDIVTDYSLDWIKNRNPNKPFFLMNHFKATHEPFDYPERLSSLYKDDTLPEPVSLYDFGPPGLAENTIVIFTSDQGYFLGEHGFFDKRMMYEESSRMPFIISYPKEIKAGKRLNDIILNTDFAALFADYAGIKKPSFIQGQSFRNNLNGKTPAAWRKSMYYRYWEHSKARPAHFGIRTDRYKLIFYYGQPLEKKEASDQVTTPAWEFYDLKKDPFELHNAITDKSYSITIQQLKKELLKQKALAGDSDAQYPVMQEIFKKYWQ